MSTEHKPNADADCRHVLLEFVDNLLADCWYFAIWTVYIATIFWYYVSWKFVTKYLALIYCRKVKIRMVDVSLAVVNKVVFQIFRSSVHHPCLISHWAGPMYRQALRYVIFFIRNSYPFNYPMRNDKLLKNLLIYDICDINNYFNHFSTRKFYFYWM